MSVIATKQKAPNGVLDFTFDWSEWLDGDTITGTPVLTPSAGIAVDSQSNTTTDVTAVISGGVAGNKETLTCQITTAGGLTDERTIAINIRNR